MSMSYLSTIWFISQTLLNVHMQNHKDRKTFDCKVCGKTLSSKQSLLLKPPLLLVVVLPIGVTARNLAVLFLKK